MKVFVEAGGQRMEITCGRGEQSIRWLALVASQRLQLMQPKGRQRMREAGDARRGFALPESVHSKEHGDLDDPNSKINEVLEDGAHVEVVLMEAVPVDDVGAPVVSGWFLKAFGSGEGTKRRTALRKSGFLSPVKPGGVKRWLQYQAEGSQLSSLRLNGIRMRSEYEAKLAADEEAGLDFKGGGGGSGSRGVAGGFDVTVEGVPVSGPLETAGEIRAAMEHDWRSADIGGLIDDPKEAMAVKGLLQSHLPTLNHVYTSRCGGRLDTPGRSTSVRTAQMMSFHDLAHALHRYGVMSYTEDDARAKGHSEEKEDESKDADLDNDTPMRKLFRSSMRGSWPGDGKVLSRAQFLSALVLVARSKEGGVVEALREIVEEALLLTHVEATNDEVGVDIARSEVQHYISDNQRLLHAVYLLYAEPSEDGALITLENFRELMDDCGVMSAMTATTSGRVKFDFLAETCFLQVQGTPPLPSLVFTEFIEASCRLAIMTAEDSSAHQAQPGATADPNGTPPRQQRPEEKSLDTIYLVLDCIIDLGLGDRGLENRK